MTPADPNQTTLAAQIVSLLAVPFVQGIARQVGQDTFNQAKTVLTRVRERFHQDKNEEAQATLALFEKNPATFQEALARLLTVTLGQHPDWAGEMRQLLAKPAMQEIIARNKATISNITMSLSGSGHQHIEADNSIIKDVDMNINTL
ncbi:MAG: hypothetical protein ABTQ73_01915 [Caldilineales bacterium]